MARPYFCGLGVRDTTIYRTPRAGHVRHVVAANNGRDPFLTWCDSGRSLKIAEDLLHGIRSKPTGFQRAH
jgi:hypothetical protein